MEKKNRRKRCSEFSIWLSIFSMSEDFCSADPWIPTDLFYLIYQASKNRSQKNFLKIFFLFKYLAHLSAKHFDLVRRVIIIIWFQANRFCQQSILWKTSFIGHSYGSVLPVKTTPPKKKKQYYDAKNFSFWRKLTMMYQDSGVYYFLRRIHSLLSTISRYILQSQSGGRRLIVNYRVIPH